MTVLQKKPMTSNSSVSITDATQKSENNGKDEYLMTSHQWASITEATSDSSLRNCLNNMGLKDTQLGYHVGIDRWTGSGAEGFLYTTLEPFGVNWENIEISLNLHRLKQYEKLENERLKKENLPPKKFIFTNFGVIFVSFKRLYGVQNSHWFWS